MVGADERPVIVTRLGNNGHPGWPETQWMIASCQTSLEEIEDDSGGDERSGVFEKGQKEPIKPGIGGRAVLKGRLCH